MTTQLAGTTRFGGLAADDQGCDGDRAPIVLLHGLSFDRTMWQPALDELRALDPDRRAIALDLPGHGQSPDASSYSFEAVLGSVREAILDAGVDAPVMVGHSAAAGTAAIYGAQYPVSGLVTVEGSFLVGEFAAALQSMRAALDGPGFGDVWGRITAGIFGLDEVAPEVRAFVTETSRPRADVVRGYWADLLEGDPDELQAMVTAGAAAIRASGVALRSVSGREPSVRDAAWLAAHLPEAATAVWRGSGHFPHVAHPRRFALLLNETAAWSRPSAAEPIAR